MGVSSDAICICIASLESYDAMPVLDMLLRVTRGSVAARPPAEADACTFILRSNSGQFVLSPVAALFRTVKARWRRAVLSSQLRRAGNLRPSALSFVKRPTHLPIALFSRGGSAQYQRKEKPRSDTGAFSMRETPPQWSKPGSLSRLVLIAAANEVTLGGVANLARRQR